MKSIVFLILIAIIFSITYFSCVGSAGVSYGVGFGGCSGPYGYGRYHPAVNTGVYRGGYR